MNKLIDGIKELEEVKNYIRLEELVDSKVEYKEILKTIFEYQKQMINAKHYNLNETFKHYQFLYNKLIKELENDVLIQLFIDALNDVNEILVNVVNILNKKINETNL